MKIITKLKKALKLFRAGDFQMLFSRVYENIMLLKLQLKLHIKRSLNPNCVILSAVEVIITEKCTLKCKNCANLLQYYSHPQHINIQQVIRDIDLLMEHVDFIHTLSLIGGETLMVKEIPEILSHIQKYKKKYFYLSITTSGTIVPSEQTLSAMRKANVFVSISDYGDKSAKLNMLVAEFKKYKITYFIPKKDWRYIQQVVNDQNRKIEEINRVFQECPTNCNSLLNGKLYLCPFLAHGDSLKIFPVDRRNYIALTDKSITKEDIREWQLRENTPPGCRYCSGNSPDLPLIPTAEQVAQALPYHKFHA